MFPVLHEHRNHRFSECNDQNCETSKDHTDPSKDGTFNMPTIAFPYHRCQRFDNWLTDKDNPIAPDMFIPNSIYRRRFKEKYLPVLEEGKPWVPLRLTTGEEEMILFEQENKEDESIYVDESGNHQIRAAANDTGPILVTVEINGIPATAPTPTLLHRPISTHSKDQNIHAYTGRVSDAQNRVIGARILKKNGSIDNGNAKKGKQIDRKEVIGFDSHTAVLIPTKKDSSKSKLKSAASTNSSKKTSEKENDDPSLQTRKESTTSATETEINDAMQRYLRATSHAGSIKNDELQSVNDSEFSELANLANHESVKDDEEPTESFAGGRSLKNKESGRSGRSSVFSEGSEFDYVKEFQKLVRENTLERMASERNSLPPLGASSWSKSYLKAAQNNQNLKSANDRRKQQEEQLRQADTAKKAPKGKAISNLGFFQRRMPNRTNETLRGNKTSQFSNSISQKSHLNLPSLVEKDPKNSKANSTNSSNVGALEAEPSYDTSFVADSGIGSSQVSASQHDDKTSESSSELGIHLYSRRKTKLPKLPSIIDKEEMETNGKGNLEDLIKGENLGADEFGKIVQRRRRKESFIVSEASFFHNGASACMVSSHCFKESGVDANINSKRRWHSFSSITEQLLYFYKTIDERRNLVENNQIIC